MQFHQRPFLLKEFKIELTYRCNLSCVHCSSDAGPTHTAEMSLGDCTRILKDAAGMGANKVAFSGGEPLLWPKLTDVVQFASDRRLQVTIYTSGNISNFRYMAGDIKNAGASTCIFSVFGACEKSHELITRVTGSFSKTLASMQDALAVGLETEVHFVPTSANFRELEGVVRAAHLAGASRVSVLRLVPQGRAALLPERILTRKQNRELFNIINNLRKSFGAEFIRTGSPYNFLLLSESPACCAAIDRLIIGPDLTIYPCDAFKRIGARELVGTDEWSCLAEASLYDCWEKSPYLEAVRGYLTSDFAEPCKSCSLLEKCLSGCLAQKTIANGSIAKMPDPDCIKGK